MTCARARCAYSASLAARPPGEGAAATPAVSLTLFAEDQQAEARAIAARVGELRREDPGARVAVLVVAHAHAIPIIAALEARGPCGARG